MKLVVVESPAKVKTISKYLGKGYKVAASMGHFVDLPKKEIGVDTEKDFEPKYVVTNRKALKKLKDSFSGVDTLIIASDLDREGEAIGWHVAQRLGVISKSGKVKDKSKKLERIIFTSITKDAIEDAVNSPRKIDTNLVEAQQARRILDRLVGYKLSPLLWKKIRFGLSAGRVQSVAVRIIVDREEERDKFKSDEYWKVFADLLEVKPTSKVTTQVIKKEDTEEDKLSFKGIKFELIRVRGKRTKVAKEKDARKILDNLLEKKWIIDDIRTKQSKRNPNPPFITSTLQRTVSNLWGYPAKKTMSIAQKLYEAGYITYMRTDSFNIVDSAVKAIRSFIKKHYGEKYLNTGKKKYVSKVTSAQEAHEAIRPTNIVKNSSDLGLTGEAQKLYDIIRCRTIATEMPSAMIESTRLQIKVGDYLFESYGQRILFDGYLKVYKEKISENIFPKLQSGQELYLATISATQHFTAPPPRYSEASLIKRLEQFGIGRPSTYVPIISTILARKYVLKEGRYFVPTETGKVVTKLLKKYFANIVDTGFTAEMEKDLDKIAEGKAEWVKVIRSFFTPFNKSVESGEKKITREEFTVLGSSKFKCPDCGKKMVRKIGRFGEFLSCADFPKCKGMRSVEGQSEADKAKETAKEAASDEFMSKYVSAPKAEDGKEMLLKVGRYGKFWAHPDYPKVKEAKPLLLKEKCPECKEYLVERKGKWGKMFTGCSGYPRCRYIQREKKAEKELRK
ncbi:MAG: type I DNA topoisomerase [Patescibacteria group bacterium]|nr:type I DNA topoisomerase [Patescibacteria group bacterium]